MKNWPESWQFLQSYEPDPKIRQLRRRFAAISNRHHRADRLRQLYQRTKVPMLMIGCAAMAYAALVLGSPWDQGTTLRHYAAAFDCGAARAVGLADLLGALGAFRARLADLPVATVVERAAGNVAGFGRERRRTGCPALAILIADRWLGA